MHEDPGVSVIIPVRDGERYLAEAIQSVLEQTLPPFDVIVVDDGSTDRSSEIAAAFGPPVRVCAIPGGASPGAAAARNWGIAQARGTFLRFLDADDLWVQDKLSKQVPVLDRDPTLDAVFGGMSSFISHDVDDAVKQRLECPEAASPAYSACTMLVRHDALLRTALFDNRWQVGEFIDWYLRAAEGGLKSIMLPDVVARRRLHSLNQGIRKRSMRGDYVRIVKEALDRRRKLGGLGHD